DRWRTNSQRYSGNANLQHRNYAARPALATTERLQGQTHAVRLVHRPGPESTAGRADPRVVNELLKNPLERRPWTVPVRPVRGRYRGAAASWAAPVPERPTH